MKTIFFLLVSFSIHAQSIDSIQLKIENDKVYELAVLKDENETLKKIMREYIQVIDSLLKYSKKYVQLYEEDKRFNDSIVEKLKTINSFQEAIISSQNKSKQLDSLRRANDLLRITMLNSQKDILQIENDQLLQRFDSLYNHSKAQNDELFLLREELLKAIKQRSETPMALPDRKSNNEISTENIFIEESEVMVAFKLWINDVGRVVLVEVLEGRTTTKDQELIQKIAKNIKEQLRYNSIKNTPIQAVFYTVKIVK